MHAFFSLQVSEGFRVPQRPLEMFFPFDPYLLKRSSRYLKLKDSFVRWKHGQPSTLATSGAGGLLGKSAAGQDGTGAQGGSDDEDDYDDDEVGGGRGGSVRAPMTMMHHP